MKNARKWLGKTQCTRIVDANAMKNARQSKKEDTVYGYSERDSDKNARKWLGKTQNTGEKDSVIRLHEQLHSTEGKKY